MKKYLLSLYSGMAIVVLSCTLASCGDDDPVSPEPVSPTITDAGGNAVLVTSVGRYRFTYDESGKLTGMSDGSETYTMQGDKFSWKDDDGIVQLDFSLNSEGCITRIKFSENDEGYKGEGAVEYSYSDHRLKSASYNAKGSNKYGTHEESGNVNYTWRDANLMQVSAECRESGREDGESYSDSWTANYTFTYGSKANTTRQFPYYMGEDITGFEDNVFCVLGLFGYGPAYLPTGYTETYTEEGRKTESHTNTLSFTQNSNGTLNSEMRNGGKRIDYTYGTAPTRADYISAQDLEQRIRALRPSLFRHRRK